VPAVADVVLLAERNETGRLHGGEFLVGLVGQHGLVTSRLIIPDAPGFRERLATGRLDDEDLARGRKQ